MFHVEQNFISKFQFNPYFSTEFLNNVQICYLGNNQRLRAAFFFVEADADFFG